jgi:S-formylglutathione hydrolase FrmB
MVFIETPGAITRSAGWLILIFWTMLGIGCSTIAPTPTLIPTARPTRPATLAPTTTPSLSPTPTSPCALAPLPDRTPIVRPTFTPLPAQPSVLPGRSQWIDTKFKSALLDRAMPMLVYLPPGYFDSTRRYPTLYMLGGFAGDYREWTYWGICEALERLTRRGKIQPMIVVLPEGDHSWWFNHAPPPVSDGKPWGDYIWREVVGYVDVNYRTLPRRASRAIGGLSAGGQAALMLALTHPQVFSIVGAHSPSIRGADGSVAAFGDPEYFKQYDPVWLIEHTQAWRQLTVWIDIGRDDTQWGEAIVKFHQRMDALGVPHEFNDAWRGIHDDAYWSAHLPDYLTWYASKLAGEK